jgi:uncharacterized protein
MRHQSHADIIKRLKRAEGHLRSIVAMMEEDRPCAELAQQLHAVEKAIGSAKRELIHDHVDHCLADAVGADAKTASAALVEFKSLTKYL